jgi:hypothetical protein
VGKGCNMRLDEAQYNKISSKAPFIQQSPNGDLSCQARKLGIPLF